jgi:probable F420-dependent oxidoreductase
MDIPVDTRLDADDLGEVAGRARELAEMGFDGAFTFEGPHDVFVPLILAAGSGADLDLMTNVAIAFPRSPVHLAHQAYDLQLLSKGRFRLGLGSQVRAHIEKRYGSQFARPVARMREVVQATHAVLRCWETGEQLDFRGEFTTHTLMPPTFNPGPNPFGVPRILVGGLGPKMVAMAAEVADGLLIHPFNTDRFVHDHTLPAVDVGLAAGGRSRADIEVVAELIMACGRDDEEQARADEGARWLLSFYASTPAYRPVLDAHGYGDLQPELNRLTKEGRWEAMPALIDDTLLDTIAVRGTPAQVGAGIAARCAGVADRVGFYFPYRVDPSCAGEILDALRAA